jgi:putative oxidoreductase
MHWALLLLRFFASGRVLYGVVDNIASQERMLEFAYYLKLYDFRFPFISAVVSVYVQAIGAALLLLGWYHRIGCLLLIFNFSVAVWTHRHDSVEQATPAAAILCISIALLLTGPGRWSWSAMLQRPAAKS